MSRWFLLAILLIAKTFPARAQFVLPAEEAVELPASALLLWTDSLPDSSPARARQAWREGLFAPLEPGQELPHGRDHWLVLEATAPAAGPDRWVFEGFYIDYMLPHDLDSDDDQPFARAGWAVHASQRQVRLGERPAFVFELDPGQSRRLLILARNDMKIGIPTDFKLIPHPAFIDHQNMKHLSQGVFQGLLWMLLLFNLARWLRRRERMYLLYIGYMSIFSYFFLNTGRYLEVFFQWHPFATLFGIWVLIPGLLVYMDFSRLFLLTPEHSPRINRLVVGFLRFGIAFSIMQIYWIFNNHWLYDRVFNNIFYSLLMPVSILVIASGLHLRLPEVKYFLLGMLAFFVGGLITILGAMGFIALDTIYFQTGLMVEFILFSIGLSVRQERVHEEDQRQIVRQLEENQRLQERVNRELERKVKERTRDINRQKEEIETQRDLLSHTNRQLLDSISYAKRIQDAVLPAPDEVSALLPRHFILFRPRDIVSGDFYWMKTLGPVVVIVAADCTGHGVPGAFMSMLGITFLNELAATGIAFRASEVLEELRGRVKAALRQSGKDGESQDGMDLALCILHTQLGWLEFAGANNPLLLVRDSAAPPPTDDPKAVQANGRTLYTLRPDKNPIGIYLREKPFRSQRVDLLPGDRFYLLSDGIQDQQGGAQGRKWMSKGLKAALLEAQALETRAQGPWLADRVDDWMGIHEQVDDMLLMGFEFVAPAPGAPALDDPGCADAPRPDSAKLI